MFSKKAKFISPDGSAHETRMPVFEAQCVHPDCLAEECTDFLLEHGLPQGEPITGNYEGNFKVFFDMFFDNF